MLRRGTICVAINNLDLTASACRALSTSCCMPRSGARSAAIGLFKTTFRGELGAKRSQNSVTATAWPASMRKRRSRACLAKYDRHFKVIKNVGRSKNAPKLLHMQPVSEKHPIPLKISKTSAYATNQQCLKTPSSMDIDKSTLVQRKCRSEIQVAKSRRRLA